MKSKLLCLVMLLLPFTAQAVEVKEVALSDARGAWLVEDHTVPVISVSLIFKHAGSTTDPQDKAGRAAMVARLLPEGTEKKDDLAFAQALEEKAIYIDTGVARDYFHISLQTLSEHKELAFDLLGEMLSQPAFDEAAIERVRKQMKTRLRKMEEVPEYLAARAFAETVFEGHPYGNPQNGTLETLDRITREDITSFHAEYLAQDNLIIGVAGDISVTQLSDLLDEALEELPDSSTLTEIPHYEIADSGSWKEVVKTLPQSVVMFGKQGVHRNDPDFYAAYVLNHIIGGNGLTSRLSQVIRKEKGLTYYIGTDLNPQLHAATFTGMFATRSEDVDQAISVMEATIEDIAAQGVMQQEVEDAVSYIIGSFPLRLDRTSAIAGYLVSMQLYDLGIDYLNRRNDFFRQVTLEQVNAVANRLLDAQALTIVKVGPASEAPVKPVETETGTEMDEQ